MGNTFLFSYFIFYRMMMPRQSQLGEWVAGERQIAFPLPQSVLTYREVGEGEVRRKK